MASATVPLLEEAVPFGEDIQEGIAKHSAHPYVLFFHVFFRSFAIASYLFCGWFSDSFITSFVFVVMFLSADFWAVKNITGRMLIGLRWWNYVDDKGVSHWIYESKGENYADKINPHEARIFWTALVVCPVVWVFLFIVALFGLKFKWLLLVFIALVLNGANLFGYIKCRFGANTNLSTTSDFVKSQVLKNAINWMAASPSSNNTNAPSN
ncbi:uncharacterized Golgi apparatus membrane protein-like protein CG5021 [Anopheles nili]|uniref:uncharacterized Golgi apparatus membrane protein-like protein CG5021 n=1 Tax=Anopheles nili TaxID=185578 RepID=UPI00237A0E13|nr:uncharacterized Golgi apparatus membrane protein-like protein CG5021 [Anopheles nili]